MAVRVRTALLASALQLCRLAGLQLLGKGGCRAGCRINFGAWDYACRAVDPGSDGPDQHAQMMKENAGVIERRCYGTN
jgi:hypothetical protein